MTPPLERLLPKLEGVTKSGNGYSARCPAHEDTRASLSITEGEHGKVLLKCHAGCDVDAIVAAVGLEIGDLFMPRLRVVNKTPKATSTTATPREGGPPVGPPENDSNTRTPPGLTLAGYAAAKRLPIAFLTEIGLSDVMVGRPCVRIPYFDASGQETRRPIPLRPHWRRPVPLAARQQADALRAVSPRTRPSGRAPDTRRRRVGRAHTLAP